MEMDTEEVKSMATGIEGYNCERSRGYGKSSGYKSFVSRKPNIKINVERLKREVRDAFERE